MPVRRLVRIVRGAALLAAGAVAAFVGLRAVEAWRAPPLSPWHAAAPDEPDADAIDAMSWEDWLAAEARVVAQMRAEAMVDAPAAGPPPLNRYVRGAAVDPAGFATDWNRSAVLRPAGEPVGAVALIHGMTDAPYSLRHVAQAYVARGWVAVLPRMPGHGTAPAGLAEATWEDWLAATRLAAREAARLAPGRPLHLVGYSNGGALAAMHALAALDDPALPRADRLVLISPMIGITRFARFAGLAGLPAALPPFARAAWLEIWPEFNPFKYNSFPVNGAVQAHRLSTALQRDLAARADRGGLDALPPVLAFQSALDSTVSARAVIDGLFRRLPANGSELILYDVNASATFAPLLRATAADAAARLVPPPPRRWRLTVVGAAGPTDAAAVARSTPAGATEAVETALGVDYPPEMFSLSHVAPPFPPWDGLYGLAPDPADFFGVRLGTAPLRGELGALSASPEVFLRLASNPFYAWSEKRLFEPPP
jgi:alpha-beta hydrolase superfamily lysophospholipase